MCTCGSLISFLGEIEVETINRAVISLSRVRGGIYSFYRLTEIFPRLYRLPFGVSFRL
jgi:hypothetical protein